MCWRATLAIVAGGGEGGGSGGTRETTCREQTGPRINRGGAAGSKPETFCLWVQMSGLTWKDEGGGGEKKKNMLMQLVVSGIQIRREMQRIKKCFFMSARLLFLPLRQRAPPSCPPNGSIHHRPVRLNSSLSPRSDPELPHSSAALHSSIFPLFLMHTPTHVHVRGCRPHTAPRKTCKEPNSSATAQADEIQAGNRTTNSTPARRAQGLGVAGEGWELAEKKNLLLSLKLPMDSLARNIPEWSAGVTTADVKQT